MKAFVFDGIFRSIRDISIDVGEKTFFVPFVSVFSF